MEETPSKVKIPVTAFLFAILGIVTICFTIFWGLILSLCFKASLGVLTHNPLFIDINLIDNAIILAAHNRHNADRVFGFLRRGHIGDWPWRFDYV